MIQKPYILALKSTVASLFVIALLWWAHKHLDARTVLESWQNVTAQGVLIVAMLILISHLLRVIRVFLAYKQRQAIQFIDVAGVSLTHNTISFLLPMRLGELALPILSRQKLNIPYLYSAATLLFIRLLDVHWLLLLVALSAANSYLPNEAKNLVWLILGLTFSAMLLAIFFIRRSERFTILRPLLKNTPIIAAMYFCSGAIWVVKLSGLAYLASALGQLSTSHAWLATIIADASALSPITGFANAGTFEAAFALPLLPLGYSGNVIFGAALNIHIFVLLINICAGALGIFILFFRKVKT